MYGEIGKRVYLDFTQAITVNSLGHLKTHRCNPDMNFKFDELWYQKTARENEKKFGCSIPWHPIIYSELTKKNIQICNNSSTGLKALKRSRQFRDSLISAESIPCSNFEISLGLPKIDDEDNDMNEAYVRLYPKSQIKMKTTVLYYDFTTLAAEIGGYAGICLGVSLVDIVRTINAYILEKMHKHSGDSKVSDSYSNKSHK